MFMKSVLKINWMVIITMVTMHANDVIIMNNDITDEQRGHFGRQCCHIQAVSLKLMHEGALFDPPFCR